MEYTVNDWMGVPRRYIIPASIGNNPINGPVIPNINDPSGATTATHLNDTAAALQELAAMHSSSIMLPLQTGAGQGTVGISKRLDYSVRKPWLDAPDGALPFDEAASVALPAIGAAAAIVASHTFPDGYDGVVNAYSWNFTGGGFVQGDGSLKVQVLRDGVPIRNYDNILVEKGSIPIPRPIAPLRGYSKQVISIAITHISNALLAGNVVGSLVGWDYPGEG